jgi:hypothetical protein
MANYNAAVPLPTQAVVQVPGVRYGIGLQGHYYNNHNWVAQRRNGSLYCWGGLASQGITGCPTNETFVNVYSSSRAFCARNATGFVKCWGSGATGAPTDGGYVTLYSSQSAFLGMRANGSWTVWGHGNDGGNTGGNAAYVPTGQIFKRVFSTSVGFAALTASGQIFSWGGTALLSGYPSGTGFTEVYSTSNSFAAIHPSNGSVYAWGGDVNIKMLV